MEPYGRYRNEQARALAPAGANHSVFGVLRPADHAGRGTGTNHRLPARPHSLALRGQRAVEQYERESNPETAGRGSGIPVPEEIAAGSDYAVRSSLAVDPRAAGGPEESEHEQSRKTASAGTSEGHF